MTGSAETLLLFAKTPCAGAVKTRLVPPLSAAAAARLYAAFLADVAARPRDAARCVAVQLAGARDDADRLAVAALLPDGMEIRAQRGADLPARLEAAFAEAFAGGAARVVVRNTDSPLLPPEREEQAFERLRAGADAVFGPDRSGGYYLVGLAASRPGLFATVATSVPDNLERTLERARALGLAVERLATEDDVDEPPDLLRLARRLAAEPAARALAPRTAAFLAGAAGAAVAAYGEEMR